MTEKQRQEALDAAAWLRNRAREFAGEGLRAVGDPAYQDSYTERLLVQAAWYVSAAETLERSAKE